MSEPDQQSRHDDARMPAPREPVFNLPAIVVGSMGLCIAFHLIRSYLLSPEQDFGLLLRAAFIPLRYSGEFEIDIYALTTPVSYAFLHGSLAHLVINMIWLAAFGSPLANRLGAARFAMFWVVSALAAAGLHYALHPLDPAPLVGASGAISGMMGAAARYGFQIDRSAAGAAFGGRTLPIAMVFRSRTVVTFLLVWMAINLASGFISFVPGEENRIAWEAHVGGFLVGFLAIQYFEPRHA
ncbi:MAG: rhomboid family intramembrane serine protease [Pseudaminobacter sp.]